MFGSESRKERSERLGFKITLWDDIKVYTYLFFRAIYHFIFPTETILISMYYNMINHFGSPEKAYKYMKDSGVVKVRRGWNKITVWVRRPGLFIGAGGKELYYLEDKLKKKIIVKEGDKLNAIERAYDHMGFVCSYHDDY